MNRVPASKPAAKKKAPPPWEAWNRDHPELVCAQANCPHNRQSIERRRTKAWQFLHQLSHGRAAFSAATLADLADITQAEAEEHIEWGLSMDLIMQAGKTAAGAFTYARYARPEGKKLPPAKARTAQAFGRAAAAMHAGQGSML